MAQQKQSQQPGSAWEEPGNAGSVAMADVRLIRASDADRDFLLTLRKRTMTEHLERVGLFLSDDDHRFRIDDLYGCAYLLHQGDEPIGLVKFHESAERVDILQLQILPEYQGRGIASQVLRRFMAMAEHSGKFLALKVLKGNPARGLYERLGFELVGEDRYEHHLHWHPAPC
ncbi:GNAT family N-acetyltransferase [Gallaecimonas sp. GXIMD4217]|uniref:GNAT family N-acetyltransferase n=1 Tax=Gallaecimonas sp. GXIMD4217 TaxID=3131927 RepID=UPI00311AC9C4